MHGSIAILIITYESHLPVLGCHFESVWRVLYQLHINRLRTALEQKQLEITST